jgi:hypothetical protein
MRKGRERSCGFGPTRPSIAVHSRRTRRPDVARDAFSPRSGLSKSSNRTDGTSPPATERKGSSAQSRRFPSCFAQHQAQVVSEPRHGTRGAERSARLCRSAGGPTGMAGENGLSATVGATANAVRWVGAPVSPAICIASSASRAGSARLR